jgi:hypothetical protein
MICSSVYRVFFILEAPFFVSITDPKPENETADKLREVSGCGPLDEKQKEDQCREKDIPKSKLYTR